MIAVWIALGIAVAGIAAGVAVALVRGLRLWREFKALGRTVGERLDGISRSTREIETHLSRAAESSERLSGSLERLRRSRAVLDVQLSALREARDTVGRAVPFLGAR